MSLTLVIILIIVVWLIVLAPLLLRGQRPILKAGEAYEETRVLHEGGSGKLSAHRGPKLTAADVRQHDEEDDYEVVVAEDAEGDEEQLLIDEPADVIDGEVVVDEEPAEIVTVVEEEAAETESDEDLEELRGGQYEVDESYTGADDLLHPDARAAAAAAAAAAEGVADEDESEGEDADLDASTDAEPDEEDLAFAKSRSGRGGWDPERDEQTTLDRYARRQRTLLGLGIFVAAAVILGLLAGGRSWLVAALAVGLTALYLFALRRQVRAERALRQRRIRHLRRARLGVRQSGVPKQLRRPGAIVMEVDDDSPDFDYLPTVSSEDYLDEDPEPTPRQRQSPRFRQAG